MIYKKITVFTDTDNLEYASACLLMTGASGTEIISTHDDDLQCFQFDYIDLQNISENAVAAYFEQGDDEAEILEFLHSKGFERVTFSEVDTESWENEWKKYLKPTKLSRFTIVPLVEGVSDSDFEREASCRAICPANSEAGANAVFDPVSKPVSETVYIIPGKAFGTGVHETTRLCVESLTKYVKKGNIVADIGTGSGILAIVAKKLGASEVFAVDNDAEALENTVLNADYNEVELRISCGNLAEDLQNFAVPSEFDRNKSNGRETDQNKITQIESDPRRGGSRRADIIVANIVVKAVIALADQIRTLLSENGIYICSGILEAEKENVKQMLEKKGWKILEDSTLGEWCAIVCTAREGNAPFSEGGGDA